MSTGPAPSLRLDVSAFREKADKRAKGLNIAELVQRLGGCNSESYGIHRAAASAHYAKAFTLYPAFRDTLANDPNHDPALFPAAMLGYTGASYRSCTGESGLQPLHLSVTFFSISISPSMNAGVIGNRPG